MASQRLCSRATGSSFAQTRPTTARPPWTPVELGTLAGWRRNPRKETTIHDRHADAGATFMWAGDWRRPHHYTSPEDEVEAVRTRVGVIDVSTLGKFRVKGPEAVTLLERLYPSRFADLAIGRIRYGVMLNDEGVIVDDGTVARLGDDEFFVTVTTGNTAALERWITWWNADWGLDVRVLNLTGRVRGGEPRRARASRDVMRSLTDADVSGEAVPYLSATTMDVAGVPALVLRIGFVGELGYEIHVPVDVRGARLGRGDGGRRADTASGRSAWRRSGSSGWRSSTSWSGRTRTPSPIRSRPGSAGRSRPTRTTSSASAGSRASTPRRPGERLVGFTCSGTWVPPEGASVVHDGVWVGRVTSARRSAAAGRHRRPGVGARRAGRATGRRSRSSSAAHRANATVAMRPFYDPDGARLRS